MHATPASPAATLIARGITVEIGGTTVLDDVSVTVTPSTCLGILGPNGAGKSTLLRVLAGVTPPDRGLRRLDPPATTVGLLAQEEAPSAGETVRQMLLRKTGVADAEAALATAARALADGSPHAEDRYTLALDRLTALAGGDIDARIEAVAGLGIAGVVDLPTAQLSVGQASKASLAAVILSRFDVTLLDEPTNDLDFAGLARLESFVTGRRGAMVVVSHDRDFLNRTITSVLELDGHRRTARHFGGGWSAYLAERVTVQRHASEAFTRYESRRDTLASRAQREREWATRGVQRQKKEPADGDRAQRGFRMNRTEQLASRARRTERSLESLAPVDKPWEPWELRFTIEQTERAGAVVVRLENATVERGDFRLGPVDIEIGWAQRIALTGPNGSGKSTLVGALVGRIPLAGGTRWIGPSVVIGELGQSRTSLGEDRSVADAVQVRCGLTEAETRSLLAKFGLGANEVGRPSNSLSPGERTRAELATFQGLGVNFLVLDEPTNHLDMEAIEQLESALDSFSGTLLLVSHDRRLLEAVATTRTIALPFSDPASP